MNQWMSRLRIAALCFSTVLLASCGGGGGDGGGSPPPPPAPDLTGTWFGTLEDFNFVMHTFSVTISGTSITEVRVDNLNNAKTGTITPRSAQVVAFTLQDGTLSPPSTGGLFLDSSATHAVFVDDEFNFGVLQKGATALPSYVNADIDGSWSGVVVTTTDLNNFSTAASSATCTHPNCTVTDSGGPSTVPFLDVNPTFGRYQSSGLSSTGAAVAAFLSPDKLFGGSYACTSFAGFPGTCEFTAWRKQ